MAGEFDHKAQQMAHPNSFIFTSRERRCPDDQPIMQYFKYRDTLLLPPYYDNPSSICSPLWPGPS